LADHLTTRRREIFQAIRERRNAVFVEVISDFRNSWDNGFTSQRGYAVAVNELTDTFLYMSSLLVAGATLGRTRLYLASEAEVQENAEVDGVIVQHPHFMYSAATQRALSFYLQPYGFRFGSLIWPLYSMQVQQLLWARYPDLSDLQYSCWRVQIGQDTCSYCEQCLRIAMIALAGGHNPERMGIKLRKLMSYSPNWEPALSPNLPKMTGARRRLGLVADTIRQVDLWRLIAVAIRPHPKRLLSPTTWWMMWRYSRLRKRACRYRNAPEIGVREAFLEWLDPDLRERLIAIYVEHFALEPRFHHAEVFDRSRILAERAAAALELA
jgi:hypothetical protein